jgi:tRNA A-37 threonylcarbamoyl transferase component Bud32
MALDDSRRLQRVIADYAAATARGEACDRGQLLLAHPDLADELQSFFAEYETSENATFEATISRHSPGAVTSPIAPAGKRRGDTSAGGDEPTVGLSNTVASKPSADPKATVIRRFGDYELLSEVARGGMGVVYKARQISLNRIVAIKMILSGQLAGETDVQRFRAEAEAAANLDHPGIVSVYEVGCHEDQHYFTMGYVEGQSLAEHVTEGPLPVEEAVELVRQVASAVQHAHERNLIHRDLKPANVLLDRSGHARVTDFGLCKRTRIDSNLTGTGQILGTPSYMPPEQASSEEIDVTADVYSLGAILYTLLTGRPPFQAATPMDTMLQLLEREPVPPRQLNGDVPRDLEIICLKCLRKDPAKRYVSARALAEDLERLQSGQTIQARPASGFERAVKWARRRPLVTALTVLLVVVSIVGFAGVAWQWRQAEMARQAELDNRKKVEQLTAELLDLYTRLDAIPKEKPSGRVPVERKSEKATSAELNQESLSEPTGASDAAKQFASAPAPAEPASDLRRAMARANRKDSQVIKRQRRQAADRLELESQLKDKISELRQIAPDLADRYQRLAPR